MKPYPSTFSESAYQALMKRVKAPLSDDEPRDDSVPAELQGEDRGPAKTGACLMCVAGAIAAALALYFFFR